MILKEPIILLANGVFPSHKTPLKALKKAQSIICLDGAVHNLIKNNMNPNLIIGDLDSIDPQYIKKYRKIIISDYNQAENDLRKSLYWLNKKKYIEVAILGATGKREDHSIGNIFSILDIDVTLKMQIITDYGTFQVIKNEEIISSYKGQEISFFTSKKDTKLTTKNLKYNLNKTKLTKMYEGTLNESLKNNFYIKCENGNVLVYKNHI